MATRPHAKTDARIFCSPKDLPKFMTMYDVADCLRISVASAYTLADKEDLPVVLFNCQRRVKREKFLEWLSRKERPIQWHQN